MRPAEKAPHPYKAEVTDLGYSSWKPAITDLNFIMIFRHFRITLFVVLAALAGQANAGKVIRVAGGGELDAHQVRATDAKLNEPFAVAFDDKGLMYIAEMVGGRILRVDLEGLITTLAGREVQADTGDGGPAKDAAFNGMHHVLYAPGDELLIADTWNHRVRRLDLAKRTVAPLVGSGKKGFSGDGGPAKSAEFGDVYCLAFGPKYRFLYLADLDNRRIRAIDVVSDIVSTVAGNGAMGVPQDGATATAAPLVDPRAVAMDSKGNLYILERSGHALRVVDPSGRIRTVVGTGRAGHAGDGGDARLSELNGPKHLCVDRNDDVLIVDTENHLVRKYLPSEGKIIRVAGCGRQGNAGEEGDPLALEMNRPHGVAVGPDGNLYISDSSNHRILKITP